MAVFSAVPVHGCLTNFLQLYSDLRCGGLLINPIQLHIRQ